MKFCIFVAFVFFYNVIVGGNKNIAGGCSGTFCENLIHVLFNLKGKYCTKCSNEEKYPELEKKDLCSSVPFVYLYFIFHLT